MFCSCSTKNGYTFSCNTCTHSVRVALLPFARGATDHIVTQRNQSANKNTDSTDSTAPNNSPEKWPSSAAPVFWFIRRITMRSTSTFVTYGIVFACIAVPSDANFSNVQVPEFEQAGLELSFRVSWDTEPESVSAESDLVDIWLLSRQPNPSSWLETVLQEVCVCPKTCKMPQRKKRCLLQCTVHVGQNCSGSCRKILQAIKSSEKVTSRESPLGAKVAICYKSSTTTPSRNAFKDRDVQYKKNRISRYI